jgi:hypothetical protein
MVFTIAIKVDVMVMFMVIKLTNSKINTVANESSVITQIVIKRTTLTIPVVD